MKPRTCVSPSGVFIVGIHKPHFRVANLREHDFIASLGSFPDGKVHENQRNFPAGDVEETQGNWIYEIPNAFPFRGTTYIGKGWADRTAAAPLSIGLPAPEQVSFASWLNRWCPQPAQTKDDIRLAMADLPEPVLLALATTSTDPLDLTILAELCCKFVYDSATGRPRGLHYQKDEQGRIKAVISNHPLFEALANNASLPDDYKEVMVLRPGVQGASEIVGEWDNGAGQSHVFEYLRRNSYIPFGHYAANMADDSIRYRLHSLMPDDMRGLRHLYYQRTYVRLAAEAGLPLPSERQALTEVELENLRLKILASLPHATPGSLRFNSTLWGWNYGFDFAPTHYRLHASHQQIPQQFAMVPAEVTAAPEPTPAGHDTGGQFNSYACGDLIADFADAYRHKTSSHFFADYLKAIRNNSRTDGRQDLEKSLIIHEDAACLLFVPKAQTSQWELQLVTQKPVGTILEADAGIRASLDHAILVAMQVLTGLGARMITTIEFSKRLDSNDPDQRLLYSFLPKLPESPGAFSEAQLRWIMGHYPEDFAIACRAKLPEVYP